MPFRDVIGHRKLVALLARSVRRESLPPSLIFAGPSGVGKRLAALATAQALNCLNPWRPDLSSSIDLSQTIELDACGSCAACTRIARGVHPDVLLVEPGDSGSIKIEPVRDLIDRAGYRPFEGRRRVVIIDEADALIPQAQNALLKTLEEPPSMSIFILVTPRPDALLATVRSRCPRLRFRPLGPDEVASALMKRGRPEAEARAIAATADGSIGRALEASGGDLIEAREIAVRVLAQAAVTDDPRRRIESAKELLTKTGAGGAGDREQLATHLRAMASLLRDVELLATRVDRRALANADVQPALERLTAFQGERGVHAFTAVDRALVALDRNAGVKVVADWVLVNL
jgi:DNA polymerase-3 subunit delta'